MLREFPGLPGAVVRRAPCGAALFNLAELLNLALRNGGGFGPNTGECSSLSSAKDVLAAFRRQTFFFVRAAFASTDAERPGLCVGLANAGDSLAALDRFVYRRCIVTPQRLLAALDADYQDRAADPCEAWETMFIRNELFRQGRIPVEKMALLNNYCTGSYPPTAGNAALRRFLLGAPKYGEGNEEADRLTAELAVAFQGAVESCPGAEGLPRKAVFCKTEAGVELGLATGATPDGRKACEPLTESLRPVREPFVGESADRVKRALRSASIIPKS